VRRHLTLTNILLCAIAFLLLSGGAYAAVQYVNGADITPHSIRAKQIHPHSLLGSDFAKGQLPHGARGPAGPRGPQGKAYVTPHSITSLQILQHSLLGIDFARGQLPRGSQGIAGPAGAVGPIGKTGVAGPKGATGAVGATGRPGLSASQFAQSTSISFSSGTPVTLDATSISIPSGITSLTLHADTIFTSSLPVTLTCEFVLDGTPDTGAPVSATSIADFGPTTDLGQSDLLGVTASVHSLALSCTGTGSGQILTSQLTAIGAG